MADAEATEEQRLRLGRRRVVRRERGAVARLEVALAPEDTPLRYRSCKGYQKNEKVPFLFSMNYSYSAGKFLLCM